MLDANDNTSPLQDPEQEGVESVEEVQTAADKSHEIQPDQNETNSNVDSKHNTDSKKSEKNSKTKTMKSSQIKLDRDSYNKKLDDIIERLIGSVKEEGKNNFKIMSAGILNTEIIDFLCTEAKSDLLSQPMLLEISAPLVIFGDIHGQFSDLVHIINLTGRPPTRRYLFLGDYVDRGPNSLETISLLLALRLRYPDCVYILRGNHECSSISKTYGFFDECKRVFSIKVWRKFCEVFRCIPIAAVIDEKIFCAHGGISEHLVDLKQINDLSRPCDVPDDGILCDILWSDPDPDTVGYTPNDRGVSYMFGYDAISKFNNKFNLDLICRAHQVETAGYRFHCEMKCISLFTAPDYCGEYNNNAAVLIVNEDLFCNINIIESKSSKKKKMNMAAKNIDKL